MTGQEIGVLVIGLVDGGYVLMRFVIRRRAGTCCGERACPAATKPQPKGDAGPRRQ